VAPVAYAGISPDHRRITPWYEVGEGGISTPQSTDLLFDAFEPNGPGGAPTDGLYGINCGIGGGRYNFLPSSLVPYCNTATVEDMTVKPGAEGTFWDRTQFLWRWCGDEVNESDLSVIFPVEDFDDTCNGPPFDNSYNGIIISFGPGNEGFWYTDVDHPSIPLQVPVDGQGGYIWFLAVAVTDTAIIINDCELCNDPSRSGPQPAFWGSKGPSEASGNGTAPWDAGPIAWDDSNPNDASWDPAQECYTYEGTPSCPDPGQKCFCIYGNAGPCSGEMCGDADCDGTFNGGDINPFFVGLTDPGAWQSTYPDCDALCTLDIDFDGSINGGDINPFFDALTAGTCPPRP
jgi:hypothetical protein